MLIIYVIGIKINKISSRLFHPRLSYYILLSPCSGPKSILSIYDICFCNRTQINTKSKYSTENYTKATSKKYISVGISK